MMAAGSKKLVTVSFPAGTSTWTAPTGVSQLISAVGKGADGAAGYWSSGYLDVLQMCFQGTGVNLATLDWSNLYSIAQAQITSLNSGGSGTRGAPSGIQQRFYAINSSDFDTGNGANYSGWFNGKLIRGVATLQSQNSPPTSGQVLYSQVSSFTGWYIGGSLEYYVDPTTGSPTTAFSLSFAGGFAGPATNTTYTSVAVTPGATYTVVNNGALTITYLS